MVWKNSGKMPAPLAEKPELDAEAAEFFADFRALSSGREYNELGAQALKLSEILAYCELRQIHHPDQRRDLLQMIQAMDAVYVKHMIDMRNSKTATPPPARK